LLPFDLLQQAVQPSSNRNSIAPNLLRQQAGAMQFRTKSGSKLPHSKNKTGHDLPPHCSLPAISPEIYIFLQSATFTSRLRVA
jgi:hypothetical protein